MKQDSSKTQARLKQDSSKTQARVKQESSKTASWGRETLKNHYAFHQSGSKRATSKENPCVQNAKNKNKKAQKPL